MSSSPDQAMLRESLKGVTEEATYGGILSFMRRRYTRDLADADVLAGENQAAGQALAEHNLDTAILEDLRDLVCDCEHRWSYRLLGVVGV